MVKKADNRTLINNIDKDGKIVVPQKSRSKICFAPACFFYSKRSSAGRFDDAPLFVINVHFARSKQIFFGSACGVWECKSLKKRFNSFSVQYRYL